MRDIIKRQSFYVNMENSRHHYRFGLIILFIYQQDKNFTDICQLYPRISSH